MNLFKNKKFTLLHILIFSVIVGIITFWLTDSWESKKHNELIASNTGSMCRLDVKRLDGLKYIKPLMFVEEECESDALASLKQKVSQIINRYKTNGDINTASFYLRTSDKGDWTSFNEQELYQPGSLFKVPVLLTILKMNEDNPGFLDRTIKFEKAYEIQRNVAFKDKSIQLGNTYSVRELLRYMIKYSDNNATALLETKMSADIFQKMFNDFGLKVPNLAAKDYFITVNEYSIFMRAIYNAAYLTIKDSEFAAELLTECDFKDGIVKGLPEKTLVAHKFGESGDQGEKQLHESAIVYAENSPYLLTIMTKGNDNAKLSKLIAEISQAVYFEMHNSAASTL